MRRFLLILLAILTGSAMPCTIFVVSRNDQVWVGANEDFGKVDSVPKHWVHFRPKAAGERFGYIGIGFPLYPKFPQAAINEAGLFYDYNALYRKDVGPTGKPLFKGSDMEAVMTQCKTVDEAVAYLSKFDVEHLSIGQMVLGDATGDSAIVERYATTRRGNADYQIGAAFRTSDPPEKRFYCPRFAKCDETLGQKKPISLESVRALCEKVEMSNQGGLTSYSTICNLKQAKLYIFRAEDFSRVAKIDVRESLTKGNRRVDLDDLMKELGKPYRAAP